MSIFDTYMSPNVWKQIGWLIEGLPALLLGASVLPECHTVNQQISNAIRGGAAINRRIFHSRGRRHHIFLVIPRISSRHAWRGQLMQGLMGHSHLLIDHWRVYKGQLNHRRDSFLLYNINGCFSYLNCRGRHHRWSNEREIHARDVLVKHLWGDLGRYLHLEILTVHLKRELGALRDFD